MSVKEKFRVIELTKGYVAVVSAEDYRRVNRHKWRVTFSAGSGKKHGEPYARGVVNGRDTYLHRFIMQDRIAECVRDGSTDREAAWHVDHKNRQTLDCRRGNLEVCLYAENIRRKRARPCRKKKNLKSSLTKPQQSPQKSGTTLTPNPLPVEQIPNTPFQVKRLHPTSEKPCETTNSQKPMSLSPIREDRQHFVLGTQSLSQGQNVPHCGQDCSTDS